MCCFGHLQQRIHISRQSVITNIVKVLYGFVYITNLQTSRFKQINEIF